MTNINYEVEVKKVYPMAVCSQKAKRQYRVWLRNKDWEKTKLFTTPKKAWQYVYETLKKQGKI